METAEAHIALRVHETERGQIIGACDIEVLGKTLSEGDLRIEINESFYFEKKATLSELMDIISDCATANLVGEKTVTAYCENNPEAKGSVRLIDGVPHLQVFRL